MCMTRDVRKAFFELSPIKTGLSIGNSLHSARVIVKIVKSFGQEPALYW